MKSKKAHVSTPSSPLTHSNSPIPTIIAEFKREYYLPIAEYVFGKPFGA
jgi:hypothetical protein